MRCIPPLTEGSVLDPDSLNERLANFMMLFRSTQPELVNYFEEEELYPNEWAPSWLQFLLAREVRTRTPLPPIPLFSVRMLQLMSPHLVAPAAFGVYSSPLGHLLYQ